MAQNLLKELLQQEQEPFHLKDYISNKQHQLKKQAKRCSVDEGIAFYREKTKPITKKNPSFFCKNGCFFSFHNSHDITMSPLFELTKSPCKSPNRIFLNVPAKTASILLEAAIRIQKQTNPTKKRVKNSGLGLFGSVLKRLKNRKRSGKAEESRGVGFSGSCCSTSSSSSTSSLLYSCSNACSCSGRLGDGGGGGDDGDEEFAFCNVLMDENGGGGGGGGDGGYGVCLSPFRFGVFSPELRSPVMCSPVKSPVHDNIEDNVKYGQEESVEKFQVEDDEEEKEQNSPVSVLDPPFDDDYDGHEQGYDLQCSYAFVQRAKHHLLHKLRRFEKLVELDPIELEKRLIEDKVDYEEYEYESFNFEEETQIDILINKIIVRSEFQDIKRPGIKRLIADLIIHEEIELDSEDQIIERVYKRLESWKEVEANTIDMMVGMDLRREIGDWKNYKEQIDETTKDLEVALFAILVDELVNDLSSY